MAESTPLMSSPAAAAAGSNATVVRNLMECAVFLEVYAIEAEATGGERVPHECGNGSGPLLRLLTSATLRPRDGHLRIEGAGRGDSFHLSFYCIVLPFVYSDVVKQCPVRACASYSIVQEGGGDVVTNLLSLQFPRPMLSGVTDV
eukprot:TRINITY_DN25600_c0_g1_i1.p2 TRINITY_DN25600_c0_g1~~TRINITY_DN25600_c0_g1_i1.p2  ORF type:complete len:145 (+),score=43.41 TRINITY_DN25600_c0_g1_i1:222-656(+)